MKQLDHFLQVNFFMLEVLHISPKITAVGFFEVDLRLYPAVNQLLNNRLRCLEHFRSFTFCLLLT